MAIWNGNGTRHCKTNSNFLLKMIGIGAFRNPKNWSQDQTRAFIKKPFFKLKLGPKVLKIEIINH